MVMKTINMAEKITLMAWNLACLLDDAIKVGMRQAEDAQGVNTLGLAKEMVRELFGRTEVRGYEKKGELK